MLADDKVVWPALQWNEASFAWCIILWLKFFPPFFFIVKLTMDKFKFDKILYFFLFKKVGELWKYKKMLN